MGCFPLHKMLRTTLAWGLLLGAASLLPAADTPASPATPPVPTVASIDFFRSLMAMTPEQRRTALAIKSAGQREVLEAKIREYAVMTDKERELRLRLLEIRLYLLPLMRMEPDMQTRMLARIPDKERPFVQYRLGDWNSLSPGEKEMLLATPSSLHAFLYRGYGRTGEGASKVGKIMPPNLDRYRERMIAKWQRLSEERRQEIVSRFDQFLALEKAKRQAVVQRLPMPDQAHAQKTLRRMEGLSPEERTQFLTGLRQFADLDYQARERFKRLTVYWNNMSIEERSLWRSIIVKVQNPPLPPGAALPALTP